MADAASSLDRVKVIDLSSVDRWISVRPATYPIMDDALPRCTELLGRQLRYLIRAINCTIQMGHLSDLPRGC